MADGEAPVAQLRLSNHLHLFFAGHGLELLTSSDLVCSCARRAANILIRGGES